MAKSKASYMDPYWTDLSTSAEKKAGIPAGLLTAIVQNGERSNPDQVSEKGATTVYQITPATRKLILDRYGIDTALSDENAAEGASLLLKEGLDRNNGDVSQAVGEYHGGVNRDNWGPKTTAYQNRVMKGFDSAKINVMSKDFADWMSQNQVQPLGNQLTQQNNVQPVDLPAAQKPTESDVPLDTTQNVNPDLTAGFGQFLADTQAAQQADASKGEPTQQTLADIITGAGEAGLSTATGLLFGMPNSMIESAKGIGASILNGTYGTQQAADAVERQAAQAAQNVTYAPRTETGQRYAGNVGKVMEQLTPIIPEVAPVGIAAESLRSAAPVARVATGKAITRTAETAKTFADKTKQMFGGDTAAAPKSIGAAEVAAADVRAAKAANLPVPVTLTKGAELRSPEQLAFEKEAMKNPDIGAPLRNRAEENNLQTLQNFDEILDSTGALAPDLAETGNKVITALSSGLKEAKNKTNAAYKKARLSEEAQAQVDLNQPLKSGDFEGTLTDFLNGKAEGVPSSAASDSIKAIGEKLGIFARDERGQLKANPVTVGQLEDFRKELSGVSKWDDAVGRRDETIVKNLIDQSTEPVAGPLYKEARGLRAEQGKRYENRAVVARLLENRKGMDDPQIAVDQVFNKSILNSSPDEIQFLKDVLHKSGADGEQAWNELQGATLKHIRDESTKGMGMDSQDRPIISPSKLHQVVNQLDKNGRLDIVLGTKNANIIRDLNDVVRYVNTTPPGTLINNSGTAGMIMAAMAEAGATGALTGLPVPVLAMLKQITAHIRNNRLKIKVNDALNKHKGGF